MVWPERQMALSVVNGVTAEVIIKSGYGKHPAAIINLKMLQRGYIWMEWVQRLTGQICASGQAAQAITSSGLL